MLYLFISFQAQARHKNRVLPRKISAWNKKRPETKVSGLFGGDKRDRTADLLNAIQALSQLSYTPKLLCRRQATKTIIARRTLFVNTFFQKNIFRRIYKRITCRTIIGRIRTDMTSKSDCGILEWNSGTAKNGERLCNWNTHEKG